MGAILAAMKTEYVVVAQSIQSCTQSIYTTALPCTCVTIHIFHYVGLTWNGNIINFCVLICILKMTIFLYVYPPALATFPPALAALHKYIVHNREFIV